MSPCRYIVKLSAFNDPKHGIISHNAYLRVSHCAYNSFSIFNCHLYIQPLENRAHQALMVCNYMTWNFRSGFSLSITVLKQLFICSSEQELLYSLKSMNVAPWLWLFFFFPASYKSINFSFVVDNIFIVKMKSKWLIYTSTHKKGKVKNHIWIGNC